MIVVSVSGGMDSTTVLARASEGGEEVVAVSFIYGSKHNLYELEAARKVCRHYGVERRVVDLSGLRWHLKSHLLNGGGDIPEGHYEAKSMSLTVVPARNIIFASILAGICQSEGGGSIMLGVHAGDHAIYPDCRPGFVEAMRKAVLEGTDGAVRLEAPFLTDTKVGILRWGVPRGVPYHLTRTCYKDQVSACGKCGACQERLEAFHEVGAQDPIEYAS